MFLDSFTQGYEIDVVTASAGAGWLATNDSGDHRGDLRFTRAAVAGDRRLDRGRQTSSKAPAINNADSAGGAGGHGYATTTSAETGGRGRRGGNASPTGTPGTLGTRGANKP
jgi:hypothetical protein